MNGPALQSSTGLHHLRVPVADMKASLTFWCEVLGYRREFDFPGQTAPAGVALHHDGGAPKVVLWEAPEAAAATRGFTLMGIGLETAEEVVELRDRLEQFGIRHSGIQGAFVEIKLPGVETPDGALLGFYVKPGSEADPGSRAPASPAADAVAPSSLFVMLGQYEETPPPELLEAHKEWLVRGFEQGIFVLSGGLDPAPARPPAAIAVMVAESREQALQILQDEPFFAAGVVSHDVVRFRPRMKKRGVEGYFEVSDLFRTVE